MSRTHIWCFTIPIDHVNENHDIFINNHDEFTIEYNSNSYTIVIIPRKSDNHCIDYPHYFGYVKPLNKSVLIETDVILLLTDAGLNCDGMHLRDYYVHI